MKKLNPRVFPLSSSQRARLYPRLFLEPLGIFGFSIWEITDGKVRAVFPKSCNPLPMPCELAEAYEEEAAFLVQDAVIEDHFFPFFEMLELRTLLFVPLYRGEKLWGFAVCGNPSPYFPLDRELLKVQAVTFWVLEELGWFQRKGGESVG